MNRKGFAPVAILLIVVGIIAIGGIWYYAARKSVSNVSDQNASSANPGANSTSTTISTTTSTITSTDTTATSVSSLFTPVSVDIKNLPQFYGSDFRGGDFVSTSTCLSPKENDDIAFEAINNDAPNTTYNVLLNGKNIGLFSAGGVSILGFTPCHNYFALESAQIDGYTSGAGDWGITVVDIKNGKLINIAPQVSYDPYSKSQAEQLNLASFIDSYSWDGNDGIDITSYLLSIGYGNSNLIRMSPKEIWNYDLATGVYSLVATIPADTPPGWTVCNYPSFGFEFEYPSAWTPYVFGRAQGMGDYPEPLAICGQPDAGELNAQLVVASSPGDWNSPTMGGMEIGPYLPMDGQAEALEQTTTQPGGSIVIGNYVLSFSSGTDTSTVNDIVKSFQVLSPAPSGDDWP
jgi:Flp pilus assembly protein TadG